MKRLLCFCLVVLMGIAPLLALDDINALTLTQRQEYLNKSLSVEVGSESYGGVYATAISGTNSVVGAAHSSTSVVWTPYLGGSQISKSDFFKIAGDEFYYSKAKAFEEAQALNRKKYQTIMGIGIGVSTVGLIVMCVPLLTQDFSDESMGTLVAGTIIASAGCGVLLFAIPLEESLKRDVDISSQYAIGVADAYNHELFQKISVNISY